MHGTALKLLLASRTRKDEVKAWLIAGVDISRRKEQARWVP